MLNTRRGFMGGTLAATGLLSAAKGIVVAETASLKSAVGEVWGGWKPGEFQVHFIYTGVGESMFLIFPDATTMLLDCGDHPALTRLDLALPVLPSPGRLAGDWVARYVTRVNPNGADVDYMMTTHWHTDHVGSLYWQSARRLKKGERRTGLVRSGFGLAVETLHFKKAIDRGWPNYDDPMSKYPNEGRMTIDLMKQVYAFLAKRDGLTVEKFRLGATDQIVPLRNPSGVNGFSVRNIAANGRIALPDGTIKDVMKHPDGSPMKCYNENLLSLGTVFSYGKFRFYTAGDFSGPGDLASSNKFYPERLIGKAAGRVDVAKINHHGCHSMPVELVRDLQARVYVACVWDQLHVTDNTMVRMSDTSLYPGERTIFPGVMSTERRAAEGDRAWMRNVPEAVYEGSHIVLSVPPGGETYRITCLTAADESMRIKATFDYKSHDVA
ncbi:MAG: MBL fold metallo-hydrolase [Kiritimatiellae bacterium]|nr:MBL fold metallo-hydrolase [Kiritimatiellia bacterium]